MWVHLARDILREFASFSGIGIDRDFAYRLRVVEPWGNDHDPWRLQRRRQLKTDRLRRQRIEIAAARPPCPGCGAKVERLGTTGTPPIYCTHECMRRTKFNRWYARQKEAA